MLLQRIQQHFIDSADLMYQCAQSVAPAVEAGVDALLACVTSGGKVLVHGAGASAGLAPTVVAAFVGRFERERPELAALGLRADVDLARQVRALGQPGDVLWVLGAEAAAPDVQAAVVAAHERDMVVVALCGAKPGPLAGLLKDTDVVVSVPSERLPRVHEVHLLAVHCLCDGVDVQLLGDDTETELEP